jgi:hypothetical protein
VIDKFRVRKKDKKMEVTGRKDNNGLIIENIVSSESENVCQ